METDPWYTNPKYLDPRMGWSISQPPDPNPVTIGISGPGALTIQTDDRGRTRLTFIPKDDTGAMIVFGEESVFGEKESN